MLKHCKSVALKMQDFRATLWALSRSHVDPFRGLLGAVLNLLGTPLEHVWTSWGHLSASLGGVFGSYFMLEASP